MKLKTIHCLVLILNGWLFGCSTSAPHQTVTESSAKQHFSDYLNSCGTNEVRCLWFLQDDPRVGMLMTIRLDEKKVDTVRDVYNWAEQGAKTRLLDEYQVDKLQQIIGHLPPPDNNGQYSSSVFVSMWEGNTAKVFQYDRRNAPAVIRQIFDIGGGYFYSNPDD